MSFNDFRKSYLGTDVIQERLNTASRLGATGITFVSDAVHTLLKDETIIAYTAITAPRIITLPPSATMVQKGPKNQVNSFYLKDQSGAAGTHSLTLQPTGGQLFDGATSFVLNTNYDSVHFYTDGSNWFSLT